MIPVLAVGIVGLLVVVFLVSSGTPVTAAGYGSQPASAPAAAVQGAQGDAPAQGGVQDIYVTALATGAYDNSYIRVQANRPVRLHFRAAPGSGCGDVLVMRDFGVQLVSSGGSEQVAEFTPGPGKYEYSCQMRMFRGVLEAV